MKKTLKYTGIVLLVLMILIIALPFLFKGKVEGIVKKEAGKMLNAHLDFNNLSISLLRNFPDVTIGLHDLSIVGSGNFEGDTLVYMDRFSATADVLSFFGSSGYKISRIQIDNALLHAIVNEKGEANWDIMKAAPEQEASGDTSDFSLELKRVEVKNSNLLYDDEAAKMNLAVRGLDFLLSGDMGADQSRIKTKAASESLTFIMDKIPYLSNVEATADMQLDADFKNSKYTFSDNKFRINAIEAGLDGWFAMPDDDKLEMDIRLNAPKTGFKDILSLVPAIYSKDFKDVQASGDVVLEAFVKGVMTEEMLPSFDVNVDVSNGRFQYPSLPKSVNGIRLKTRITNPGGAADKTEIDVPSFHFELGGNPFDMTLNLKTPVSDPDFKLSAVGHLDLGMVREIYPLEDMELNGKLDADLRVAARMSAIEKAQYDRVNASGGLSLKNMVFKGIMKDDVLIDQAVLHFSPQYLNLDRCDVVIGKNDISATGRLENFLPYALKNETLKGVLSLKSNHLNLNDFMTDSKSPAANDTVTTAVFSVPRNLNFDLSGNFQSVKFENLDMTNVSGRILVNNGKIDLKDVKMNALDGAMTANGYYDTSINPDRPELSVDLDIKDASFAKTFASFQTVKILVPILEAITGNYSTSFKMKSPLGADFMPVLTDFDASGLLQSSNVAVQNAGVLNLVAAALKNESLKSMKIKDLKLPFSVDNGRVTTKPFDINFNGGKMNLSGSTGLDQSIDYVAKVDLPQNITGGYVNKVNLKIGGTFSSPKVSVDAADLANQAINQLAGKVLGGGDSTTVTEKVNAQITQQADEIRKKAKESADKIVEEADKQGRKLIDEANKTKNPLAKVAAVAGAQTAAKKLKEEAVKQSQKIYDEAEKQINDLEKSAKQE